MIAITPPKIFSKEVAQKQATPHVRADDLEAFPSGLGHAASGTTYLPTR